MNANVGTTDKVIRIGIAVVALIAAFSVGATSGLGIGLIVVGVIMVVTAVTGMCPIYRLFGMNTCKVRTH
jgi:Protein of unknown function (DUF2892)